MAITAERMWDDMMEEFERWVSSGMAPNMYNGKTYATGYGGPNKGNETINTAAKSVNKEKWIDFGKTNRRAKKDLTSDKDFLLMYFDVVVSLSGGSQGVQDFKCGTFDNSRTFVYHIIVSDT